MPRYVVERVFPDGLDVPSGPNGVNKCREVAGRNADAGVTWLHSYVSDDHAKTFCVYEAPSPEAIRASAARNDFPVHRITEVRLLDPYSYA